MFAWLRSNRCSIEVRGQSPCFLGRAALLRGRSDPAPKPLDHPRLLQRNPVAGLAAHLDLLSPVALQHPFLIESLPRRFPVVGVVSVGLDRVRDGLSVGARRVDRSGRLLEDLFHVAGAGGVEADQRGPVLRCLDRFRSHLGPRAASAGHVGRLACVATANFGVGRRLGLTSGAAAASGGHGGVGAAEGEMAGGVKAGKGPQPVLKCFRALAPGSGTLDSPAKRPG